MTHDPKALDPKTFLTAIFDAAVAAADPELTIRKHLPAKPKGRTVVIGAGKGAAQMAAAFENAWDGPFDGLVVTRYGYGAPTKRIEVIEAGTGQGRLADRVRHHGACGPTLNKLHRSFDRLLDDRRVGRVRIPCDDRFCAGHRQNGKRVGK